MVKHGRVQWGFHGIRRGRRPCANLLLNNSLWHTQQMQVGAVTSSRCGPRRWRHQISPAYLFCCSHQSRAGDATSLLCQPLKGTSGGQEHNVAGAAPSQDSLKQRRQKETCFEDSPDSGICFLSKHHPRVLLDSSLWTIKKRFNLHQLFLELVEQPNLLLPTRLSW